MSRQLFFFESLGATSIQGRQLFKGGNYCFIDFWKFHNMNCCRNTCNDTLYDICYGAHLKVKLTKDLWSFFQSSLNNSLSHCGSLKFKKNTYLPSCCKSTYLLIYLLNIFEVEWKYKLVSIKCTFQCDKYSRETTTQGRKLLIIRTFLVRQVFKGDNYSREETIRGNTVSVFVQNRKKKEWKYFTLNKS